MLYPRSSVVIVGSSESVHTVLKATPFLNVGEGNSFPKRWHPEGDGTTPSKRSGPF